MTKVVFHINMNGVTLHINGDWESKHFRRTHVDKIGEDLANKLGGILLYWEEAES